jgi:hypothetical protein
MGRLAASSTRRKFLRGCGPEAVGSKLKALRPHAPEKSGIADCCADAAGAIAVTSTALAMNNFLSANPDNATAPQHPVQL